AARALGLQLIVLRASNEREIDAAFATIARQDGWALLVTVDPFFLARRDQIVALATRDAIPALYPVRDFAVAGGLISYGTDFADSYRQCGIYIGRIVRGEKPADLPVQRSVKFEFVINLKPAKALGLSVPNAMQLHRVGNRESQCLRGLEVDHEFELDRPLHRQVGRLLAPHNSADVDAALAI